MSGDVAFTRRGLLVMGAAVTAAACTGGDAPQPSTTAAPSVDRREVLAAIARERDLLARYAAANPRVAEDLAEAATRHELHLQALLATEWADPIEASPQAPTGSASPSVAATPGSADSSPAGLAKAEAAAAKAGLIAVSAVADASLAGLLASIAASESGSSAEAGR